MRTIIAISDEQLEELSYICKKKNISRAEAIRQSIGLYINNIKFHNDNDAFGIWGSKKIDSLEYQNKLRTEWE